MTSAPPGSPARPRPAARQEPTPLICRPFGWQRLPLIGCGLVIALVVVGWGGRWSVERLAGWRARGFARAAATAWQTGDLAAAEINLRSALRLRPTSSGVRTHLVQLAVARNDYNGALVEAEPLARRLGVGPDQYLFDLLLLQRDFSRLSRFAAHQACREPERTEFWLRCAIEAGRVAGRTVPADLPLPPPAAAVAAAAGAGLRGEPARAAALLEEVDPGAVSPSLALLVVEEWLRLGRNEEAALAFLRCRHKLNTFDAALIEFVLALRREPWLASSLLDPLLELAVTPHRRGSVGAVLLREGAGEQARRVLAAWAANSREILDVEELGMGWVLAHRFAPAQVEAWAEAYRHRTGAVLPDLWGRKLRATEARHRSRAVNLLLGHVPLSREMLFALFGMVQQPPEGTAEAKLAPEPPGRT